ncbi:hypothetical protein PoB_000495800 [Plakobranchus ocellatus]|uniref:Uncharacterized protein n=1 Tax=Plakobranchus ocellatus TaxID=259542 RepID=A0AAV3Y7H3_9GAST|nr:hypothetical protein PoB_000495800 [Plakobranchus ocellatus]
MLIKSHKLYSFLVGQLATQSDIQELYPSPSQINLSLILRVHPALNGKLRHSRPRESKGDEENNGKLPHNAAFQEQSDPYSWFPDAWLRLSAGPTYNLKPSPGPSSSAPSPTPSSHSSLAGSISSELSLKDFFLRELIPRFQQPARGRSERINRFRYCESLTADECFARLQEAASAKEAAASRRGRGKGRGRARGRGGSAVAATPTQRSRSRSPLSSSYEEEESECCRCGTSGTDTNWIQYDICDSWFH